MCRSLQLNCVAPSLRPTATPSLARVQCTSHPSILHTTSPSLLRNLSVFSFSSLSNLHSLLTSCIIMATQTILDDEVELFWRVVHELPFPETSSVFHRRLHNLLNFCILQSLKADTISSTQRVKALMKTPHPYPRAPNDSSTLEDLSKLPSAFSKDLEALPITGFREQREIIDEIWRGQKMAYVGIRVLPYEIDELRCYALFIYVGGTFTFVLCWKSHTSSLDKVVLCECVPIAYAQRSRTITAIKRLLIRFDKTCHTCSQAVKKCTSLLVARKPSSNLSRSRDQQFSHSQYMALHLQDALKPP